MDPSMFGPGSFLGKLLFGQREGGDSGASFGSMSAPVQGAPGASVPLPPPRPNEAPQPGAQPGGGPSLGMMDFLRQKFGGGQNAAQASPQASAQQHANQMQGIQQIMKTLQGPEIKPAQFQPMQLQGGAGGPMQLPPMPLTNM